MKSLWATKDWCVCVLLYSTQLNAYNGHMDNEGLDKSIKAYFNENPSIEEALDVFNISQTAYVESINGLTEQRTVINSKTTTSNG